MTDKTQTTIHKIYKIGYQIIDGEKAPLTKEQEEWWERVLRKSFQDTKDKINEQN